MTVTCLHPRYAANPYAAEIDAVLPRLLALGDTDRLSLTRGVLDRQFWAWKLIDFPNATFQGAANGLSVLVGLDALAGHLDSQSIVRRIADIFRATRRMQRSNGSLEEAFPHEQSYCVTALVAFDLLKSLDVKVVEDSVRAVIEPNEVIGPLANFLVRSDESHGLISNHLATAAAALVRWHKRVGDQRAKTKADVLLNRIFRHQSREGWFSEYGGADPGYQTLCTSHLADIFQQQPSDRLANALNQSVRFLRYFVHPDGSFGGLYGSRATRIYYPSGIELLSSLSQDAAQLAFRMRDSIARMATVPLRAIDQPNMVPLFNSYCTAFGAHLHSQANMSPAAPPRGVQTFPQAGLIVDIGEHHHTVVSTRKGGVVYHWVDGRLRVCDTGIAVRDGTGRLATSQTDDASNHVQQETSSIAVSGTLRLLKQPLPGPLQFIILRALAITVMRVPLVSACVKKLLARYLVAAQRRAVGRFQRTITLGQELTIADDFDPKVLQRASKTTPFSAIHMASQGYWQVGDDIKGPAAESDDNPRP